MSDKKSSESRRKLLKSIAAGSGAFIAGKSIPESWSRPVVDSVMLPAHALTSTGPYAGFAESNFGANDVDSDSTFARLSDALVTPAHANGVPYVCVTLNAGFQAATVDLYLGNTKYTFADVPVGGSQKCSPGQSDPCALSDVSDLLRDLGLVTDAHAAVEPFDICCVLNSVGPKAMGNINIGSVQTIPFNIDPGVCNYVCPG